MESLPVPRLWGDNFIKPWVTLGFYLPQGDRGLSQMGFLKFSTFFF